MAKSSLNPTRNTISRREFAQILAGAGVYGALASFRGPGGLISKAWATDTHDRGISRISYRSQRGLDFEGRFKARKIEGVIPRDLQGTLVRIGSGQKENHGISYNHLFDGDAYLSRFQFNQGEFEGESRFVNTPERREEAAASQMLYNEFGTKAPGKPKGFKNQPSVNVIAWDGKYLALSEGGHPSAIDANTLEFTDHWDFNGTLPGKVSFTAHPKIDPTTGDGYAFGYQQGIGLALKVYQMQKSDGKLRELYSLRQNGYYMVHDMIQSENHLVLVVPPLYFKLIDLMLGHAPLADYMQFDAGLKTRVYVLDKKGAGKPIEIELPPSTLFHHGNAFEKDGDLYFDSILSQDAWGMKLLSSWGKAVLPSNPASGPSHLVRTRINLATGQLVSQTPIIESIEYPRFDDRYAGRELSHMFGVGTNGNPNDVLDQNRLVKVALDGSESLVITADADKTFGEPIFVPVAHGGESEGYILAMGYSATEDETFIEVRSSERLELVARVWLGQRLPLGFHGNFYPA